MWHFISKDRRMRHEDSQLIEAGKTYKVEGEPALCKHGLHASNRAISALLYAPGPIICRVELGGIVKHEEVKSVATERTVIWMADATDDLRDFARWSALQVAHLWDIPQVTRQHLETGDESLMADAYKACAQIPYRTAKDSTGKAAMVSACVASDDRIDVCDAARVASRVSDSVDYNSELERRLLALRGE